MLGRGAQATVWLARDTRLHREVAVKWLADGGDAKIFEFELWSNGKPVDPESYIVF